MRNAPANASSRASDLAFQIEALSGSSAPTGAAQAVTVTGRRGRLRPLIIAAVGIILIAAAFTAGRQAARLDGNPSYQQLTFRQGGLYSARFTSDAATVVYSAGWDGNRTQLYSTLPGSRGSRPIGVEDAEILAISEAGEMAILINPAFTGGWMRNGTLARLPPAGGMPRRVAEFVQDATWGPDGNRLAVSRVVEGQYRLEYPIGTTLYQTQGWISWPRFSRDGRSIAFLHHPNGGDDRGLVMVTDLSGNAEELAGPYSTAAGLAWSPSGEEIWFTAAIIGNSRALYAVDRDGNQRLVDSVPADLTLQDVAGRRRGSDHP